MKSALLSVLLMFTVLLTFSGCQKFIEVDLPGSKPSPDLVFKNDESAVSAVRGMYGEIAMNPYFNNGAIPLLTGLSADELLGQSTRYQPFSTNQLSAANSELKTQCWQAGYRHIYNANAIIEGLQAAKGMTTAMVDQLRAEALFIRAFSHFYLANLFGPVPLIVNTDLHTNLHLSRVGEDLVFEQVQSDLLEAQRLFENDKELLFTRDLFPRSRANYWAATAMLARLHLYKKNWELAEQQASLILEGTSLFALEAPDRVFLSSSKEAIWQLLPVLDGQGSQDAQLFIPPPDEPAYFYLTSSLVDAFEPGDLRGMAWTDSLNWEGVEYCYPAKYRERVIKQEFHIELRLAEMYLIRAEARAQLEKHDARNDVNVLRVRAGLIPLDEASLTKDQLLNRIAQERRVELFAEGGHRWQDLRRTGKIDQVLSSLPYKIWQETDVLYPVPQTEILDNPGLNPQNKGY